MEKRAVLQAGGSVNDKGGALRTVRTAVSWLIPLAIGVGIAMWLFHQVRFEQQADGVMSPAVAVDLGLIRPYQACHVLGPPVLPELASRFSESRDAAFRAVLVELARQVRSPDALPLFASALRDDSPEVWKEALDGLVALASPAAIALLEEAMGRTPPGRTEVSEWQSWIQEALQQARAELAARGGVA